VEVYQKKIILQTKSEKNLTIYKKSIAELLPSKSLAHGKEIL
jgi:sRNA-binding regulator protein Hfq